jgi:hypothetical protein
MSENQIQIFRREPFSRIGYNIVLLIFLGFCIWLFREAFFIYSKSDVVGVRWLSMAMIAFYPIIFWGRVYLGDIHVDDEFLAGCGEKDSTISSGLT